MIKAASANIDRASIFIHCRASPVVGRVSAECRLKSKSRPEPEPQLGNFEWMQRPILSIQNHLPTNIIHAVAHPSQP